jgi:hypothetical protein
VVVTFGEMGLSDPIARAITELGYEEPTPIQQQTIPVLMAGHDLIGQAQTGTGKTAAFGIPMLERIRPDGKHPQGLVLAPTRELAIQDAEAIHGLGRYTDVSIVPIYGGQPIERLTSRKLKPGRLPTAADGAARRREALKETLRSVLEGPDLQPYLLVVEELAADYDVAEVAAPAPGIGPTSYLFAVREETGLALRP